MNGPKDSKTELVAGIIERATSHPIRKILVVGCGSGLEAAILARCLDAEVVGIDVEDNFDPASARSADLQLGDATALSFENNTFDFIYSYHALEHIPDPGKALSEMNRVLKDDGGFWVGTPNRLRLLGYLGSKDASLWDKIHWNYIDWKARLLGRFRNEMGAHAGFARGELYAMLRTEFSHVDDVTDIYFSTLYSGHQKLLRILSATGLSVVTYPSVYFMGKK